MDIIIPVDADDDTVTRLVQDAARDLGTLHIELAPAWERGRQTATRHSFARSRYFSRALTAGDPV